MSLLLKGFLLLLFFYPCSFLYIKSAVFVGLENFQSKIDWVPQALFYFLILELFNCSSFLSSSCRERCDSFLESSRVLSICLFHFQLCLFDDDKRR